MFNMIKRTLSGESDSPKNDEKKQKLERTNATDITNSISTNSGDSEQTDSGDDTSSEEMETNVNNDVTAEESILLMPEETPEWGKQLLKIIKNDFKTLTKQIQGAQKDATQVKSDIISVNKKVEALELRNDALSTENNELKEKLLELEFRQRRNNLQFNGFIESEGERDYDCYRKVCNAVSRIPGIDTTTMKIERCHRKGPRYSGVNRTIICAFSWYGDVTTILRNKQKLPRGIFASEDLPDDWVDRRRILRPLYNAAKRKEDLKNVTFMTKDKLIVNGKTYSAGPVSNIHELSETLCLSDSCQQSNVEKTVFQGIHSVFSNLHPCSFRLNNITYNSVEQYFQSEKAKYFNDDRTQAKVMAEKNPYKVKKLGSRVKGFNIERWKTERSKTMLHGLKAKFSQNPTLLQILKNTGTAKIAEATTDNTWGIGLRLFDKNVMNEAYWKQEGLMCELYTRVRSELK